MFAKFCITMIISLLLLGCEKKETDTRTPTAQEKQHWEVITEQSRQAKLKRHGVSVLHLPPKINFNEPIRLENDLCLDPTKLPKPWYFINPKSQKHSLRGDVSLALAANSKFLGIPYYQLTLETPVNYAYVTPFQEFLEVNLITIPTNIKPQNFLNKNLYAVSGIKNGFLEEINFQIENTSGWKFKAFSHSYSHLPKRPEGSRKIAVLFDTKNQASVKVRLNEQLVSADTYKQELRPTAGFFSAPHIEGIFLHATEKVLVEFKTSGRATAKSPYLFEIINDTLDAIIIDCDALE